MKKRIARIIRNTKETEISLTLNLDGRGKFEGETGIGFFDHMLTLLAKHGMFDIEIKAKGDLYVDDHHLVEDIGIVIGKAIKEAVNNKMGICRFGSMILPMDEVLCVCAVDLAGRFSFETNYNPVSEKVNDFSTEMLREFFKALALNAEMNLHIQFLNSGQNEHHRIEAVFKSFARALKNACEIDEKNKDVLPSTKGII